MTHKYIAWPSQRSSYTKQAMTMQDQYNDQEMMRLALEQARCAAGQGEVPVGAVIYRGQEVLAVASNRRESAADPTAHAEILALREAAGKLGTWRLDGCSIAVTLEPCPMCAGALVNARVQRLVYGAADPKMGAVDTLYQLCTDARFNHRLEVSRGLLSDESRQLLQHFFGARRGNDKPPKPVSKGSRDRGTEGPRGQ